MWWCSETSQLPRSVPVFFEVHLDKMSAPLKFDALVTYRVQMK